MEHRERSDTPLKWHRVQNYFLLPVLTLIAGYLLYVYLQDHLTDTCALPFNTERILHTLYSWHLFTLFPYATWQTILLMLLLLTFLLLCAVLIGMFFWKAFGIACLWIYQGICTLLSIGFLLSGIGIFSTNARAVPFIANSLFYASGFPYTFLQVPSFVWMFLLCMNVLVNVLLLAWNIFYYKDRLLLFISKEEQEEVLQDQIGISRKDLAEMKFCPFCGTALPQEPVLYCENCGRKIR